MAVAIRGRVLVTGATGFIGGQLVPALIEAGYPVRCATRHVADAQRAYPDREWVAMDVEDAASVASAMQGCDAAFYLVHGMAAGSDYPQHEQHSAEIFAAEAARAGLRQIVYLGGVIPSARASRHLRSRQRTGEILRAGSTRCVELRAAMVIGAGSASWMMVRDLAARLPAMLLPRWLRNSSYPIASADVVRGLMLALELRTNGSQCFDLPGPERVTHRQILQRTAHALGHDRMMIDVPVLTPRLSSYWIALVTRVDLKLARELVEGVRQDLVPTRPTLWDVVEQSPVALDEAIRQAIAAEPAVP